MYNLKCHDWQSAQGYSVQHGLDAAVWAVADGGFEIPDCAFYA